MKNIYDATDEAKKEIMEWDNEDLIYHKRWQRPEISDFVLIRETNIFPVNGIVQPIDIDEKTGERSSNWTLNGANLSGKDFIIIEPFSEQVENPSLANINEEDTWFLEDVKLSEKAIILMSEESYRLRCNEEPKFREQADKQNIALYRGDQELALRMLLHDRKYTFFELDEDGFVPTDEYGDMLKYIDKLHEAEESIVDELQKSDRDVTFEERHEFYEDENLQAADEIGFSFLKLEEEHLYIDNIHELCGKMITGLTPEVEGDIELDGECFATTAIGKVRENQEDAVLLVKDEKNPQFKMMVVADGMGGEKNGEQASHILVTKLQQWFKQLDDDEKKAFYTGVSELEESLKAKIIEISYDIDWHLYGLGGSTFVCALIGQNDTLVTNIGDSRGYIIKNGKLEQVTIDDSIVQEEFEKGNIPNKDAMRFHKDAAGITQAVGIGRIEQIHTKVLNNDDYDMLLLFSDGVTDCLSEEDIAVICKTTDREEISRILVKKAIEHDSFGPDFLYEEYEDYKSGGHDNLTALSFSPKKDEEEER